MHKWYAMVSASSMQGMHKLSLSSYKTSINSINCHKLALGHTTLVSTLGNFGPLNNVAELENKINQ